MNFNYSGLSLSQLLITRYDHLSKSEMYVYTTAYLKEVYQSQRTKYGTLKIISLSNILWEKFKINFFIGAFSIICKIVRTLIKLIVLIAVIKIFQFQNCFVVRSCKPTLRLRFNKLQ